MDQLALVEEVLGQTASRVNTSATGGAGGACTAYFYCPGAASHSTPSKPTDCQVKIYDDGRMPSVSCLHASCETALRTAALAIIHRIREAERMLRYVVDAHVPSAEAARERIARLRKESGGK